MNEEFALQLAHELQALLQTRLGAAHGDIVIGFVAAVDTQDLAGRSTTWLLSTPDAAIAYKLGLHNYGRIACEEQIRRNILGDRNE